MGLRSLSVGNRAGAIFMFIGFLVLVMGAIALSQSKKMDSATDQIRVVYLPSIIALGNVGTDFGRARALTVRALLLKDQQKKSKEISDAKQLMQTIAKNMAEYEKLIQDPDDKKLFDAFMPAFKRYDENQGKVLDFIVAGQNEQAADLIDGELASASTDMREKLEALVKRNSSEAVAAADFSSETFNSAFMMIVSSLVVLVVVLIAVAIGLTRSIVSPLADAVTVANRVAGGDLTQAISVTGNDEPAQLLAALQKMQTSLRETIQRISGTSDQLASASEELHAVTEDANQGLSRQNIEIDQAATAVNEMTVAVEEVASNAVSTADASEGANRNTQEGREKVNQAVASINYLVGDVFSTSEEIKKLSGNVNKISQVLVVIRSIAEQTNLLALNAAIEAARAGEAGRGFAVVADEVRALAHRTQQSTAEIEQMIDEVQSGTQGAVQAMEQSQGRATSTLEVAQAANEALDVISTAITAINQKNLVIASASEEQAQVAREVDRNLVNIRDLSMQSAAGANQTSAASQELSRLAVDLNAMIAQFKV